MVDVWIISVNIVNIEIFFHKIVSFWKIKMPINFIIVKILTWNNCFWFLLTRILKWDITSYIFWTFKSVRTFAKRSNFDPKFPENHLIWINKITYIEFVLLRPFQKCIGLWGIDLQINSYQLFSNLRKSVRKFAKRSNFDPKFPESGSR